MRSTEAVKPDKIVELSYVADVDQDTNDLDDPVSLDAGRTRRFLKHLADEPFLAIVSDRDGQVVIYSKDIDSDHLARIKEALSEIQHEQEG